MKPEIVGLGILTFVAGLILLLKQFLPALIPSFLTTGYMFLGIMVVIGILHMMWGFNQNNSMMYSGVGFIGIVIILWGILPVVAGFLKFIPSFLVTGYVYMGVILLIGVAEAIYGNSQM